MPSRRPISRSDLDAGRVDLSEVDSGARLAPVHPGEVLRHDFLEPLGLSAHALALALRVPANRISAIVSGRRAVTAETALRLGRHFGTTPAFWLTLQRHMNWNRPSARPGHASAPRSRRGPLHRLPRRRATCGTALASGWNSPSSRSPRSPGPASSAGGPRAATNPPSAMVLLCIRGLSRCRGPESRRGSSISSTWDEGRSWAPASRRRSPTRSRRLWTSSTTRWTPSCRGATSWRSRGRPMASGRSRRVCTPRGWRGAASWSPRTTATSWGLALGRGRAGSRADAPRGRPRGHGRLRRVGPQRGHGHRAPASRRAAACLRGQPDPRGGDRGRAQGCGCEDFRLAPLALAPRATPRHAAECGLLPAAHGPHGTAERDDEKPPVPRHRRRGAAGVSGPRHPVARRHRRGG